MRKIPVLLLLLFVPPVPAHAETSRPMSEMHGNCENFKSDVKRELALWKDKGLRVPSGESLRLGKKLHLPLAKDASYLVKPGKTFSVKGESFGGVFALRRVSGSKLRVSAGSKVWFDLVDVKGKARVPATEFEMQTDCDRVFKTVLFDVEPGKQYALQVSSAPQGAATFVVRTLD